MSTPKVMSSCDGRCYLLDEDREEALRMERERERMFALHIDAINEDAKRAAPKQQNDVSMIRFLLIVVAFVAAVGFYNAVFTDKPWGGGGYTYDLRNAND